MQFYMKVHEGRGGRVVAVCDADLLGNVFSDGKKVLDLMSYSSFYNGKKVSEAEVLEGLKTFTSINIVGKNAVALAVREGIISKSNVAEIMGVPHAQAYRI